MGFFDKLKAGLHKTTARLTHELKRIVSGSPKLTASTIEELETALIAAMALGSIAMPILLHTIGLQWSLAVFAIVISAAVLPAFGRLRRLDEIGFVWSVFDMVWEKMFEELREFKAREGHCNVPNRYQTNPALAQWVSTQRKAWKELNDKRNLPERFRRLESAGFVWDLIGGIWEKRFEELRAFKEKEGHCNVPQKYPLNTALARWVVSQRSEWKKIKDKINVPERFRRLEELGFAWDVYAAPWEVMFECLVAFKDKHGHCNVPAKHPENPALGIWVHRQRSAWKKLADKTNLPERFRRLEELGFMWILKGRHA